MSDAKQTSRLVMAHAYGAKWSPIPTFQPPGQPSSSAAATAWRAAAPLPAPPSFPDAQAALVDLLARRDAALSSAIGDLSASAGSAGVISGGGLTGANSVPDTQRDPGDTGA